MASAQGVPRGESSRSPIVPTTHPERGVVSQGEVLTLGNFDRWVRGLITPVQLERVIGIRMFLAVTSCEPSRQHR